MTINRRKVLSWIGASAAAPAAAKNLDFQVSAPAKANPAEVVELLATCWASCAPFTVRAGPILAPPDLDQLVKMTINNRSGRINDLR